MSIPFQTKQFEDPAVPNRYMPRRKVRLDKVVPTQATYDEKKVSSIAAKEGSAITKDPIVGRKGGLYHVLDGHHRVAGAIARGDTHIDVRIVR